MKYSRGSSERKPAALKDVGSTGTSNATRSPWIKPAEPLPAGRGRAQGTYRGQNRGGARTNHLRTRSQHHQGASAGYQSSHSADRASALPPWQVSPRVAAQPQLAQHSALMVHSGTTSDQGGTVLFFSSVQKRGGAFTTTENETRRQLHHRQRQRTEGQQSSSTISSPLHSKSMARDLFTKGQENGSTHQVPPPALTSASVGGVGARKRNRFDPGSSEDDDG